MQTLAPSLHQHAWSFGELAYLASLLLARSRSRHLFTVWPQDHPSWWCGSGNAWWGNMGTAFSSGSELSGPLYPYTAQVFVTLVLSNQPLSPSSNFDKLKLPLEAKAFSCFVESVTNRSHSNFSPNFFLNSHFLFLFSHKYKWPIWFQRCAFFFRKEGLFSSSNWSICSYFVIEQKMKEHPLSSKESLAQLH